MPSFSRKSLAAITAYGLPLLVLPFLRGADASKITWPGELDGPKSLWIAQATLYAFGTCGDSAALVANAEDDFPPTNAKPFDQVDHATIGTMQQSGHLNSATTYSSYSGHVAVDTVITATDSYSSLADGKSVGSQQSTAVLHFDVSPCPEVDGAAHGQVSIQLRQETTYADGSKSSATMLAEGPFRIVNGDDAHRVRTELDLQISGGSVHTAPSATDADPVAWGLAGPVNLSWGTSGPGTTVTGPTESWSWAGDFSFDGMILSAAQVLAERTVIGLEPEVEKFWRSGKCIELKPSEKTRDVAPLEKIELKVEAEQHFDHKEVKAPIKAELTGVKSVDPNGKPVDAPAEFAYVAGPKNKDQGTLDLTQTGKRGIGRTSVTFTTKGGDLIYSSEVNGGPPGKLIKTIVPATRLVLQDDGSYLGRATLSINVNIDSPPTRIFGEGTNQLTIRAQQNEFDPRKFRVTLSLQVVPITLHVIHRIGIGAPTQPFELEDEMPWGGIYDLEVDKVYPIGAHYVTGKQSLTKVPIHP